MEFFLSFFDTESLELIDKLDLDIIKVPSGEITDHFLLEEIAKKQKDVIMSVGMSTVEEIDEAVDVLQKSRTISLLHCVSASPTDIEDANLSAITTIKDKFGLVTGLSDHSANNYIAAASVALGVKIIEKHFTSDNNLLGPDHKASLDADELKKMVSEIRETELILGSYDKRPTESEEEIKKVVRKSLVAKNRINKGTIISRDLIEIKRPGTGISPVEIDKIVGKKAIVDIEKDALLQFNMVE